MITHITEANPKTDSKKGATLIAKNVVPKLLRLNMYGRL